MLKKILYCTLLLHFIPTYLFAQTTTPPEIEWQRFWGYAYSPYDFEWKNNTKIFVTADSNYIFAANPNLAQSVTEDLGTCSNVNGSIFVVKMARNGHVLWRKQYQNSFNLCDFRPTNDGGYVLLTAIQSLNFGGQPVITKIDQNGAVIWQRLYADIQYITGYQNGGILRSIRPTADGGYIVLARTSAVTGPWQVTYPQISQTPTDILVFKVNSTGFLSWSKIIGGSERDTPRAIAEMPD
jgi:hypothetical protein